MVALIHLALELSTEISVSAQGHLRAYGADAEDPFQSPPAPARRRARTQEQVDNQESALDMSGGGEETTRAVGDVSAYRPPRAPQRRSE